MRISQKTLSAIIRKRQKISALENELQTMEQGVEQALKDGATCSGGMFVAFLKEHSRRNVAWRQVCERKVDELKGDGEGVKFCEHVLAATRPDTYTKLVVEAKS